MSNSYAIDKERWAKLSIFDQMGNIYSEVGRSFKSKDSDVENFQAAVTRAIELFDATALALSKSKSPRSKEVLRAKEQFLDVVYSDHVSPESRLSLERYFSQFAIAARLNACKLVAIASLKAL